MKRILLILILFTLISCEGLRSKRGTVFDLKTKEPLDEVIIRYYGEKNKTDSWGRFDISAFIGCTSKCPDFEVYFEKKGYQTLYVNFTNEFDRNAIDEKPVEIYLKPTSDNQPIFTDSYLSKGVLIYSRIMLLICVLTFLTSLFLKVNYKVLWIIVILWGNFSLRYNVITSNFDWSIFNSPITGVYQYKWDIYFISLGALAYWVYYFRFNKRLPAKENKKELQS